MKEHLENKSYEERQTLALESIAESLRMLTHPPMVTTLPKGVNLKPGSITYVDRL